MPNSPAAETEEMLDQQNTEESSTSGEQDIESNAEESSTSGESESEITTLDLVQNAINESNKDNDATEGSSDKDGESEDEDESDKDESEDEDDSDEPTEDEKKQWKAKVRKRFEQLQGRLRDVTEERDKLGVDAGKFKQFDDFLTQNNISQDEANQLFNIGAWMKSDPFKALEAMTPYYNQLLQVTGNVLPGDLKQQVTQGYITEAHALELSRQRAMNQHHQVLTQQHQYRQQQNAVNQQQQLSGQIQTALADLEKSWKTSDPDYEMKSARIQERVKLMWYDASQKGQMPRSVDEAVSMAERAKTEIEKEFRKFRPKKAVSSVDGGSSSQAAPEPKSTLDVINTVVG